MSIDSILLGLGLLELLKTGFCKFQSPTIPLVETVETEGNPAMILSVH
jgi:hypothetical protein